MNDRRDILRNFAVLLGAELCGPLAQALAQDIPSITGGFAASRSVFSAAQTAQVTAICDRIVPVTDTPGAVAAGVPAFIEMMLADWYAPKERDDFLAGFVALENDCFARFGHGLAAATPARQDIVLTAAMNGGVGGLPPGFFEHCRQLVFLGYYSSEIGCRQERIYLPLPQRFDGFYPYPGKVFSS
jgi:hypothetical protein